MKKAKIECEILGKTVEFTGEGEDMVVAWGKVIDAIDRFKEERKAEIDLVRDDVWKKYDRAVERRSRK